MKKQYGFTLIELLVVIAIIALLSSVVLSSLSVARMKSRDARRVSDIRQIFLALQMFYDTNGCLPTSASSPSACANAGGYVSTSGDGMSSNSSNAGFLSFLVAAGYFKQVPVDPINTISPAYVYVYNCYNSFPGNNGLKLSYWKEYPVRTYTAAIFELSGSIPSYENTEFACK
jgi:prepilin-type N-terminal cleavage/methylation domain-containing protein